MSKFVRCCYSRVYLFGNRRHFSNDGQKTNTLQNILNQLKSVNEQGKGSQSVPSKGRERIYDAAKAIKTIKTTQRELKETNKTVQRPLPIPTKLDILREYEAKDDELQIEMEIEDQYKHATQMETEENIGKQQKERPKDTRQEKTDFKIEMKNYHEMASNIKKNIKNQSMDLSQCMIDTNNINDDISQWIYNKILENNGQSLPTIPDIIDNFPLISIQKATDVRDNLVNDIVERNSSHNQNNSGHFKNDDFIQNFDPSFHRNGVNLNGLNPETFYGYNNNVFDDYNNYFEPNLKEVSSEYGKFSYLLSRDTLHKTDINMIVDLKRKINKIHKSKQNITFGLSSENRKEFIAKGNYGHNNAMDYFRHLFYLIDDIIHLSKPFIISTSGLLSDVSLPIFLSSSARLADEKTSIALNHCLYGQIPFGGLFYQMCRTNDNGNLFLWHLLSNEPITCDNAHKHFEMIDWIMPSPNNALFFNHFGNEIDKTFGVNFREQDQFRHRAKIKSIIQLFDEGCDAPHMGGMETNHNNINHWIMKQITNNGNNHNILDLMQKLKELSNGDFSHYETDNESEIETMIYKTNMALKNINSASPLALYLSHILYFGSLKEYNNISSGMQSGTCTQFFRKLLSYEYNALCWLMYFGDFGEGIKSKTDQTYVPKWKWSTMETLLTSKDINFLISQDENYANILKNSIIFNESPQAWIKSLQFNEEMDSTEAQNKLDSTEACISWQETTKINLPSENHGYRKHY